MIETIDTIDEVDKVDKVDKVDQAENISAFRRKVLRNARKGRRVGGKKIILATLCYS